MAQPRVLILRAPGTNCDGETTFAFERAGARVEPSHINRLLEWPRRLGEFQILCIPGGFSYGDDIAAGHILATQIRHHLAECIQMFHGEGKLILGICNGFQVLLKAGLLLPLDPDHGARATLTWNDSGKFEDRWVALQTGDCNSVFFRGIERLYLPIAHAEGKFVPRSSQVLEELERNKQVVLRYAGRHDRAAHLACEIALPYPENPDGSAANIAGICDSTGRICGLMPHPERYIEQTQHPRWTRGDAGAVGDGLRVFQNAVGYFN